MSNQQIIPKHTRVQLADMILARLDKSTVAKAVAQFKSAGDQAWASVDDLLLDESARDIFNVFPAGMTALHARPLQGMAKTSHIYGREKT